MWRRSPTLVLALLLLSARPALTGSAFLTQQLVYPRVRAAWDAKAEGLKKAFLAVGADYPPRAILLRVFKQDGALELWAQSAQGDYREVKSYRICAASGHLGPKEVEGDGQVPEGFYSVSAFNPWSQFHLSLGVSYPNAADRVRSGARRPGGLIMIHGDCVTIGCIPLTDPMIDEVYLAAVLARNAGPSAIPIHIFPTRLDADGWSRLERQPEASPVARKLWEQLRPGFEAFERTHRLPDIRIGRDGNYIITER